LIDAGTWDYKNVVPRQVLEAKARRYEAKIAIGKLMTIMRWKNAESAANKKLKARKVFLANNVKDEFGLANDSKRSKSPPQRSQD
jgi:hypothetical protein